MQKSNVILIGMPGAGKSTIGVILAKRLGFHFIDTDLLIQIQEKRRLQQIIDQHGLQHFRQIEEQILLQLDAERSVIATGGSVIYSTNGMEKLADSGCLTYIHVPLLLLQQRIADMGQRGLVMAKGQTFEDLYLERTPLYEKFAEITISSHDKNAEQVAAKIEKKLLQTWASPSS
ncbi:shikimate kinase [Desulfuromusa kysingii]|uniref:Shikimate kinase n=1 Tax=Desulfuromusa kysingii TaxID=37625 RepID=A0A1H3W459_9BACT|nr:shikimate kinase [Desulfuromusa kysingii]SDZ81068.1 shikimate kinase [Desulfuromusa kysingii]